MSIHVTPTREQRKNTWVRLKKIFKLTDDHKVTQDWNAESFNDKVMIRITMFEVITIEEFNALFNGEPVKDEGP